ncbi:hypothetical protein SAMN02910298_01924 [Pseudobutyrivibrio sp. YE44]|uniref:hypothetical protein n=1 Tax=Pseudobutyrivibrio sp. YE44 TaxID=1520802 RepID=UPI00088DE84F|nr:hypothetical protein [Pseudobutyrivibrio sp. YE44]SDB38990.1 hypothetical protein SAMN02910298_01924 [Pseudobutyrivibrio sp. YE44]
MKNPSNEIINKGYTIIGALLLLLYGTFCENISLKAFIIVSIVLIAGGIIINKRICYDTALLILAQALILVVYSNFFLRGLVDTHATEIMAPVLAYIVGLSLVRKSEGRNNTTLLYFALFIGLGIYGIMSIALTKKTGAIGTYFGIKQANPELMNLQLVEFFFLGISASLIWAVITFKNHKAISTILILAAIVIQPVMIKLHGRYNAYIFVVELIVLLALLINKLVSSKIDNQVKARVISATIITAIIALSLLIFNLDIVNIKSKYYTSFWGIDGGLLKSAKFLNMKEMFKLLFINWHNPSYITSNGINTSFNLWLDFGRDYGIVCFAVIYAFKICTVINAIRLVISKKVTAEIKVLLLPAFVILNIFYSYEYIAKTNTYLLNAGLVVATMISVNLKGNNWGESK